MCIELKVVLKIRVRPNLLEAKMNAPLRQLIVCTFNDHVLQYYKAVMEKLPSTNQPDSLKKDLNNLLEYYPVLRQKIFPPGQQSGTIDREMNSKKFKDLFSELKTKVSSHNGMNSKSSTTKTAQVFAVETTRAAMKSKTKKTVIVTEIEIPSINHKVNMTFKEIHVKNRESKLVKEISLPMTKEPKLQSTETLVQRQNPLKDKLKNILVGQNVKFEQNVDKDMFSRLGEMIRNSKVRSSLHIYLTMILNHYIIRYYYTIIKVSSLSVQNDINEELDFVLSEFPRVQRQELKDAPISGKPETDLFNKAGKLFEEINAKITIAANSSAAPLTSSNVNSVPTNSPDVFPSNGDDGPEAMNLTEFIRRQQIVKTFVRTFLLMKNAEFKQNLGNNLSTRLDGLIRDSNAQISPLLRQIMVCAMNNYILRYYKTVLDESPSLDMSGPVKEELISLLKKHPRIKDRELNPLTEADKQTFDQILRLLLNDMTEKTSGQSTVASNRQEDRVTKAGQHDKSGKKSSYQWGSTSQIPIKEVDPMPTVIPPKNLAELIKQQAPLTDKETTNRLLRLLTVSALYHYILLYYKAVSEKDQTTNLPNNLNKQLNRLVDTYPDLKTRELSDTPNPTEAEKTSYNNKTGHWFVETIDEIKRLTSQLKNNGNPTRLEGLKPSEQIVERQSRRPIMSTSWDITTASGSGNDKNLDADGSKPLLSKEVLLERQNSLKDKLRSLLNDQNIQFEQNLDKDIFSRLESMMGNSNVRSSFRIVVKMILNHYIIRYYYVIIKVSRLIVPRDLNEELDFILSELERMKKRELTDAPMRTKPEADLLNEAGKLFQEVNTRITFVNNTDVAAPTTTLAQMPAVVTTRGAMKSKTKKTVIVTEVKIPSSPEEMMMPKEVHVKTKHVKEMPVQPKMKRTKGDFQANITTAPEVAMTNREPSLRSTEAKAVKEVWSAIQVEADSKVTASPLKPNEVPNKDICLEEQKATFARLKAFIISNNAKINCEENIDQDVFSMLNGLLANYSKTSDKPSPAVRLIVKIIIYQYLLEYYGTVMDITKGVALPKQLRDQLEIMTAKYECLKREKALDIMSLTSTDQAFFKACNNGVFSISEHRNPKIIRISPTKWKSIVILLSTIV
uniref:Uncharacterized protein n=1 Tax=Romanomermis culicivorax TaxID=13658 RepID=A0A915I5U1_ROMCU